MAIVSTIALIPVGELVLPAESVAVQQRSRSLRADQGMRADRCEPVGTVATLQSIDVMFEPPVSVSSAVTVPVTGIDLNQPAFPSGGASSDTDTVGGCGHIPARLLLVNQSAVVTGPGPPTAPTPGPVAPEPGCRVRVEVSTVVDAERQV